MRLIMCAVGHRMPRWVSAGFEQYAQRMPSERSVELGEIRPERRPAKEASAAETARILAAESTRIRAAVPAKYEVVVLDEKGRSFSTKEFASHIEGWRREGLNVAFVI